MSYPHNSSHMTATHPNYYSATPPAPPPKPSTNSTPQNGPPLPPPPPNQTQNEPQELDGSENAQFKYQQQPGLPYIPPIEPNWIPGILKEKTTTDLHNLLQDPSLLSSLLDNPETTHPALTTSKATLQPLIEANLAQATGLTRLEAQLTHQRAQTQSRLLALRALEQQHRTKLVETEKALQAFSPTALYQRLSASVQEQESLVKGLEESWLDEGGQVGEREVTEFLKRVKDGKKVAFLRKERKERWDEGRVGGWR